MNQRLKMGLWAVGILILVAVGWYFYGTFGGGVNYYRCENGLYFTYPKNITDGTSTYYDKEGNVVGECRSWVPGPTCENAKKLAGTCSTKASLWR
jgi:hypothetical protein